MVHGNLLHQYTHIALEGEGVRILNVLVFEVVKVDLACRPRVEVLPDLV